MTKVVLWSLFILPWISLLFMNKLALRRYMPTALFATVLNTIIYQLAWALDWWKYKETLFFWDKVAQAHTVYGVFLVGTLWIFRITFRRFWLYLLFNMGTDLLYAFGFRSLWKAMGITAGGNLHPIWSFSMMTAVSLLLYAYQIWQERIYAADLEPDPNDKRVIVKWISKSYKTWFNGAKTGP